MLLIDFSTDKAKLNTFKSYKETLIHKTFYEYFFDLILPRAFDHETRLFRNLWLALSLSPFKFFRATLSASNGSNGSKGKEGYICAHLGLWVENKGEIPLRDFEAFSAMVADYHAIILSQNTCFCQCF